VEIVMALLGVWGSDVGAASCPGVLVFVSWLAVVILLFLLFGVDACSVVGGVVNGEARDGAGCLEGVEDASVFDD